MSSKYRKPYKYSRKAGRYVSTSKRANRSYYADLLNKTIKFNVDIDYNSTYGKYIIKKLTPELKIYKRINSTVNDLQLNIRIREKNLEIAIKDKRIFLENKFKESIRKKTMEFAFEKNKFYRISSKFGKVWLIIISLFPFVLGINLISTLAISIIIYFLSTKYLRNFEREIEKSFEMKANLFFNQDDIKISLNKFRRKSLGTINLLKNELKLNTDKLRIQRILIVDKVDYLLNQNWLKFALSKDFYNSTDWKNIRNEVLRTNINRCVICEKTKDLTVDHIKPRSKFPELAIDISNTQILCRSCNSSKGNKTKANRMATNKKTKN